MRFRCFFICAFVPIYWLSRLVVHLLVLVVEAKLFTNAKVLFFLLSVRVRHPDALFITAI